jgi:hypothetical protein
VRWVLLQAQRLNHVAARLVRQNVPERSRRKGQLRGPFPQIGSNGTGYSLSRSIALASELTGPRAARKRRFRRVLGGAVEAAFWVSIAEPGSLTTWVIGVVSPGEVRIYSDLWRQQFETGAVERIGYWFAKSGSPKPSRA